MRSTTASGGERGRGPSDSLRTTRPRQNRRRGRPQPLSRVRSRRGRAEPDDGWPLGAAARHGIRGGALETPCQHGSATAAARQPDRTRRPAEDYKHLFLLELTASDRQSLLSPGLFRFLHRWPPGDSGGDNAFSTRHYVPNRWHHIVAQKSNGRLELYVDGTPSQPVTPKSAIASEPCRLLLGRLKPMPRPVGRVHSRPYVGLIDELALYHRPLSAEEVRRHYELGTTDWRSSESRAHLHRPRPCQAGRILDSSMDAFISSTVPGLWIKAPVRRNAM